MLYIFRQLRFSFPLTFTLCILLFATCKKSGGGFDGQDENLDTTSPSVIDDLIVTEMTPTGVHLQWTAPGDDRDSGKATIYDLRYLQHAITPINWDSAISVQGLPVPSQSNTHDSIAVTGLAEDSTYYFAIKASDEAGNWSGLSKVVTAVCFDNYAVTFSDSVFENIIRFYITKPTGDILRSDLLPFEGINLNNQHIHDLTGIEHCINLRNLQLWNNNVSDLTPLAGLNKLRVLKVGYNGLTDISTLAPLVGLDTLYLNANSITDISALAGMNNLTELVLTSNTIWNTAPLEGKTTIRYLYLDGNDIVFTNPLYNLTGIEKLQLSNNKIDDIYPLAVNNGLGAGDTLWLTGNPLSASTTDSLISVLRDRGVVVIR